MSATPPNLGVQATAAGQTPGIAERVYSVDVLRGLIMVIMALDHVRDYFTDFPFLPEDLLHTWPALFFTRWITHFCAPWFCFLAGTGAYLATSRGKSPSFMRNLLWKRGVWLIVFGWVLMWIIFPLWLGINSLLWMFGWSMIALSAMAKLPLKWIAAIGVALVFLHNLADPIKPAQFGHLAWLWTLLHVPGGIGPYPPHLLFGRIPINSFYSAYPLLPWPGVMAAGYAFDAVMKQPIPSRRRTLLWLGTASIVLFILLRTTNLYGNPHAPDPFTCGDFQRQTTLGKTVIALLDTEKYPPSLQFLLMTLGPGFLALAAFDRLRTDAQGLKSRIARFFLVYGRVPLFYYVLHVYLIHVLAIAVALALHQPVDDLLRLDFSRPPTLYSHGLPFVYAMWIAVVLMLYLPCRWFMELKRRRHDWWLQYI